MGVAEDLLPVVHVAVFVADEVLMKFYCSQ